MVIPIFLDLRYNIWRTTRKLPTKPVVRWISARDRQVSCLGQIYQPKEHEMRQVFDKIDTNKDGKISLEELSWLFKKLGKGIEDKEVGEVMKAVDTDLDGFISFKEFMDVHKKGVTQCDMKAAFKMFDSDGDGRIGAGEVREVMEKIGESCSLEECERMVRGADFDRDGVVGMEDFLAMMTKT
ncbi:hypothetical protein QJS10_CPA06g02351 [Acorus calamus]|uniref:EF-hand domain-containing protein n=1 Tax=Acorus calamus TaxID=4465 RepID=A0AAV9EP79_ACOCL|nr:hypothetical protein QJS10_CPA06g02351 [Acorus calamus]